MQELPNIILVPVDGSKCATEAASYAGTLAKALDVPIRFLFAFPRSASDLLGGVPIAHGAEVSHFSPQTFAKIRRSAAEAAFEPARTALKDSQLVIEERILDGEPAEEILAHAAETDAPMVVIGRRGLSTFREILLGSVTQRVLHHAKCPVLVIR